MQCVPQNGKKPVELTQYFDTQARTLVRKSGRVALKKIRSGKAGSNLAWTELRLLAALIR